jgi:hypothetical protein
MPFILLGIAMQAVASANGIGPDLSEASEKQSEGSPEMSDRRGDGFQMQGSKSEIGLRARSERASAQRSDRS